MVIYALIKKHEFFQKRNNTVDFYFNGLKKVKNGGPIPVVDSPGPPLTRGQRAGAKYVDSKRSVFIGLSVC